MTNEDLAKMVTDWKGLQAEQKAVATHLADMAIDMDGETKKIVESFNNMVSDMNLSDDAYASGKATIDGFINGAESMRPQVELAFQTIAFAARRALDDALKIHSPSKEMEYRAEMTWLGFINKTYAMEEQVAAAMSSTAHAGVRGVEREASIVSLAPEFVAALSARGSGLSDGGGNITVTNNFEINAGAATERESIRALLNEAGDQIADKVIEVYEERQRDSLRRQYS